MNKIQWCGVLSALLLAGVSGPCLAQPAQINAQMISEPILPRINAASASLAQPLLTATVHSSNRTMHGAGSVSVAGLAGSGMDVTDSAADTRQHAATTVNFGFIDGGGIGISKRF